MKTKHYDRAVLKTESILFDEIRPRITREIAGAMIAELTAVASASARLDQIKKHLFYGRPLPGVPQGPAHAQSEDGPTDGQVGLQVTEAQLRLLHGLLGLISESSEMIDGLGIKLGEQMTITPDMVNVAEEIGDILWYASVMCDASGSDTATAMKKNLAKLEKRYGGSFSAEKANDRDLDAERDILKK
jgi:NTP pyrophosphatase (non-canonical NTP hydrolase)